MWLIGELFTRWWYFPKLWYNWLYWVDCRDKSRNKMAFPHYLQIILITRIDGGAGMRIADNISTMTWQKLCNTNMAAFLSNTRPQDGNWSKLASVSARLISLPISSCSFHSSAYDADIIKRRFVENVLLRIFKFSSV